MLIFTCCVCASWVDAFLARLRRATRHQARQAARNALKRCHAAKTSSLRAERPRTPVEDKQRLTCWLRQIDDDDSSFAVSLFVRDSGLSHVRRFPTRPTTIAM